MGERSASNSLLGHLALGAAMWALGGLLYGLVETGTNTAAGLYLPGRIVVSVLVVYAILGAVGGAGFALVAFGVRPLRAAARARPAPFYLAAFFAALAFVYVALRVNDRLLPFLLSPVSLAVNLFLLALAATICSILHRHLRSMRAFRLALSVVALAVAFGLFVSVGLQLDTFVVPRLSRPRVALLYAALAVACTLIYGTSRWVVRLLGGRRTLAGAGLVMLVGVSAAVSGQGAADAPRAGATNVVWLVLDTLRVDHLSCYGYPRPTTPHLDAMAAEGALFENAIAGASWTIPSHFQMVTGRFDSGKRNVLEDRFTTAAELLRAGGYRTGAVLANQSLGRMSGFEQGFETFIDGPPVLLYLELLEKTPIAERLVWWHVLPAATALPLLHRKTFNQTGRADADAIDDHVLAWLDRQRDAPFFLFVNYMDPHEPYAPPEPFRSRFAPGVDPEEGFIRYDRRSGKIISTEEFVRDIVPGLTPHDWDDLRALYDGEIAFLDDQVGRVVAKLKALGVYDRTLVVVTADHGELFGEHGLATHFKSLSEEEIHVPLIVRYPPRIAAGTRVVAPVELVDILPTALETTGLPPPQGLDGKSLLATAAPGTDTADAEAHSYLLRKPSKAFPHTAPGDLVALRTGAFKYVWSSTGRNLYYNLAVDPRAEHDGYEGDSVMLAAIAQRVEAWRRAIGLDTVGREPVDPLTEQRLRSLGYVR